MCHTSCVLTLTCTLVTWCRSLGGAVGVAEAHRVIVLAQGEEGSAAGAAHGPRPRPETQEVRVRGRATLPVCQEMITGLRGCQGVEAELRRQGGQRLSGARALLVEIGVGLSCDLVNRVQSSLKMPDLVGDINIVTISQKGYLINKPGVLDLLLLHQQSCL